MAPPEASRTTPPMLPYTACAWRAETLRIEHQRLRQTSFTSAPRRTVHMAVENGCRIPEISRPLRRERLGIAYYPPFEIRDTRKSQIDDPTTRPARTSRNGSTSKTEPYRPNPKESSFKKPDNAEMNEKTAETLGTHSMKRFTFYRLSAKLVKQI